MQIPLNCTKEEDLMINDLLPKVHNYVFVAHGPNTEKCILGITKTKQYSIHVGLNQTIY